MNLTVFIPYVPPGINKQYGYARGHTYLTKEARDWRTKAGLLIGSCAGQNNWRHNVKSYDLEVEWWGRKHDEDAHLKIIQDTLALKLGFNDKIVKKASIVKLDKPPENYKIYGEGLVIKLLGSADEPS